LALDFDTWGRVGMIATHDVAGGGVDSGGRCGVKQRELL
jgi:hypothetical protein